MKYQNAKGEIGEVILGLPGRRFRHFDLCYLIFALSPLLTGSFAQSAAAGDAFFDLRSRHADYAGPGREQAAPADVTEALIGYFGPASLEHRQAGQIWAGASLAIEQANQQGGYNGLPFRLVASWSENPWGSGVRHVARMAYADKVWAVIGGIDGPSTHLAEQVVAKARLALVNPASTDKTVNLANVPWMFSVLPQDNILAEVLAEAVASQVDQGTLVLVSTVSHDCHMFTVELRKSLTRRKLAAAYSFDFEPGQGRPGELVYSVMRADPAAVVLIAEAEQSARLVKLIRDEGYTGLVFGGPWMGQLAFAEQAGASAEGVLFPLLYSSGPKATSFEQHFVRRFQRRPDYLAAHAYDATNLLVAAIRKAGLNRALIRDAIRELSPWGGVTGGIEWDNLGANSRPATLGTIRAGRTEPVDPMPATSTAAAPLKYLP